MVAQGIATANRAPCNAIGSKRCDQGLQRLGERDKLELREGLRENKRAESLREITRDEKVIWVRCMVGERSNQREKVARDCESRERSKREERKSGEKTKKKWRGGETERGRRREKKGKPTPAPKTRSFWA